MRPKRGRPIKVTLLTPQGFEELHEKASKLNKKSTTPEVLDVLKDYKTVCWPDWPEDHPANGTIAWFMASFLPEWLGESQAEIKRLAESLVDHA